MIPLIVAGLAGAAVGAVASNALSDDKPKVIHYYHEGVSEEDADAVYQKAQDYYYGRKGCSQDITKAIKLYAKAADLGHRGAIANLKNFGIHCH